jgi:hypothetical protein
MRHRHRNTHTLLATRFRSHSHTLLHRLMMSSLLVALVVPAHAYNPDPSHQWITEKAIEYLRIVDPLAYRLANQYKKQLVKAAWYTPTVLGNP